MISIRARAEHADGCKIVYWGHGNLGRAVEYIYQLLYCPGVEPRIVKFTRDQLQIEDGRPLITPLGESIPEGSRRFLYSFTPNAALGVDDFYGLLITAAGFIVRRPELMKDEESRKAAFELVESLGR